MKKLFNLILVIALAIGFVSCDKSGWPDSKYQSKLVGEWSLTSIAINYSAEGVNQSMTISVPNAEIGINSLVLDLKRDNSFTMTTDYDGDNEAFGGTYKVANGKLILTGVYEYDGYTETEEIHFDIKEVSNKNLELGIVYVDGEEDLFSSVNATLNFNKL